MRGSVSIMLLYVLLMTMVICIKWIKSKSKQQKESTIIARQLATQMKTNLIQNSLIKTSTRLANHIIQNGKKEEDQYRKIGMATNMKRMKDEILIITDWSSNEKEGRMKMIGMRCCKVRAVVGSMEWCMEVINVLFHDIGWLAASWVIFLLSILYDMVRQSSWCFD